MYTITSYPTTSKDWYIKGTYTSNTTGQSTYFETPAVFYPNSAINMTATQEKLTSLVPIFETQLQNTQGI